MKYFLLFLGSVAFSFLTAAEIELLDGTLVKTNVEWKDNVIKAKDKTFPLNQISSILFATETPQKLENQQRITLVDGSVLIAQITTGDTEKIRIKNEKGDLQELSLKNIHALSFANLEGNLSTAVPKGSAFVVMAWGKIMECKPSWITFLDVGIEQSGQELKLKRGVVAELNFANPLRKNTEANIVVKSRYGDILKGKLMKLDSDLVQINTIIGELEIAATNLLEIEIISDKVVSLLELNPTKVNTTAYLDDMIFKPTFNTNFLGGYIKKGAKEYSTGICMQSKTSVIYALDGKFSRFTSEISLDDRLAYSGNADFVIYGDGKEILRKNMDLKSPIQKVDVKVAGLNSLTIELDFADFGNSGDFGIWGNPRLYR